MAAAAPSPAGGCRGCRVSVPTGTGGAASSPPAHSGTGARRGPVGARWRGARAEGRGRGAASGGTYLSLGRGPAARLPRRLREARGFLRGPQAGGGAEPRRRAQRPPLAHTPSRRPRARAGILAAAGSHRAPGPLPTRAPGRREPLVGWEHDPGALLLSLSSAPVWGRAPRTPCTAHSSTPPAPAGRAGSAHVRGCLAAPWSPVAEAPPELRALETPCSSGLLPGSSLAAPRPRGRPHHNPRPALAGAGFLGPLRRPPPGCSEGRGAPTPAPSLSNGSLGFQAAQPEERLGARALTLAHTHALCTYRQTHAGGELELGRRCSFLSSPKKLPTLTPANCCFWALDNSPEHLRP